MINNFQKEYGKYWKKGKEISGASSSLRQVYALHKQRLAEESMELAETVKGKDFREEVIGDMQVYSGKEEVSKQFVRFKHTLYEKKETLTSHYVVKDGKVSSYSRRDNFEGTRRRYIRLASEAAVIIGAMMSMWFPDRGPTMLYRVCELVIAILIAAIPVAAVTCLKFSKANAQQKICEEDEVKRGIAIQKEFDEENIPIIYEEIKGVIDTQVKLVHYAKEEADIQHIQMKSPEKMLKRYKPVVDCSIGEAEFGVYEKKGRTETIPVDVTVFELRSNGKTLKPDKERVQLWMERKARDWKVKEYSITH